MSQRENVFVATSHGLAEFATFLVDRLVAARPELPMRLTHGLDLVTAAYLPGRPLHDFPPRTSVDLPGIDLWRPWIVG